MDHTIEIKQVLSDVLGLSERINAMTIDTFLLGNIPEFDSVAVVTVILALEKRFLISINDDEISAQTFQTLGTLVNFVKKKVAEKDKF